MIPRSRRLMRCNGFSIYRRVRFRLSSWLAHLFWHQPLPVTIPTPVTPTGSAPLLLSPIGLKALVIALLTGAFVVATSRDTAHGSLDYVILKDSIAAHYGYQPDGAVKAKDNYQGQWQDILVLTLVDEHRRRVGIPVKAGDKMLTPGTELLIYGGGSPEPLGRLPTATVEQFYAVNQLAQQYQLSESLRLLVLKAHIQGVRLEQIGDVLNQFRDNEQFAKQRIYERLVLHPDMFSEASRREIEKFNQQQIDRLIEQARRAGIPADEIQQAITSEIENRARHWRIYCRKEPIVNDWSMVRAVCRVYQ